MLSIFSLIFPPDRIGFIVISKSWFMNSGGIFKQCWTLEPFFMTVYVSKLSPQIFNWDILCILYQGPKCMSTLWNNHLGDVVDRESLGVSRENRWKKDDRFSLGSLGFAFSYDPTGRATPRQVAKKRDDKTYRPSFPSRLASRICARTCHQAYGKSLHRYIYNERKIPTMFGFLPPPVRNRLICLGRLPCTGVSAIPFTLLNTILVACVRTVSHYMF